MPKPYNIVDDIFSRHPQENAAIIADGAQVTYRDLHERSAAIADQLRAALPITAATRIALKAPGGTSYITTALGILRAGACFLPVPDELTEKEQVDLLRTTAANALITFDNRGAPKIEVLDAPTPEFPENEFAALTPAFIRFSSGTTGKSKGVILSHRSLLDRISTANRTLNLSNADRVFWALPMAHHFAVSIVLYLWSGAVTLLADTNLGAEMLTAMANHRATVFYGSPFHVNLLTAAAEQTTDRPPLRLVVSTASALQSGSALQFHEKFNLPVTQALGIIEAGLPIINADPDDAIKHPTAIGRPQPGYDIQIAEDGTLQIRGPGMFDAYLSPWKTRADVTDADGWFATGDLVSQDESGLITVNGRAAAVINVAGLKCFPEEIEAILNAHPAVRASRVFARPHPITGATPAAEIIPRDANSPPPKSQLLAYCRESLAAYKIPLSISFVEALPTTASGKILRQQSNSLVR